MRINEILELVPVGGSFYRESKPDVIYERIGALIERDGLGWAKIEVNEFGCDWTILPDQQTDEEILATDWTLHKNSQQERAAPTKKPRLLPLITEKTRHAWTHHRSN
jgi:hypothetical protein